ncbi:GntR family transcriptional regulator [Egbenema bharatensis]|uniref:GntR family transcriptional regulator n=1 Tax=Egbenema bharatensis TaxID=3463334 RepID=UPI003A898DF0
MKLTDIAANLLQHQRSTPDLIADALRQAILYGVFAEGQSLRQDEIATQFGVSRIPVREALRQLEVEGLVTFFPNRGAVVTVLSIAEVQEIVEIRIALETTALQYAIPNQSQTCWATAERILVETDQATDFNRWAELNWEFHSTLYTPADRPRLLSMIRMLHINVDRYVRLQLKQTNYQEHSQQEHYRLLEYCQQQDAKGAIEGLKRHIGDAGKELVGYLRQLRD